MSTSSMKWTPEFEAEYVRNTSRTELLNRMESFAKVFQVGQLAVTQNMLAIDVGCGPVGGMLGFLDPCSKVGIDPLADYYRQIGWLPEDVSIIAGYAESLPLRDMSVDVAFCVEALDHCASLHHFRQAQEELARVLKPGGTLLFMLPARSQPRDGHPCAPDGHSVTQWFRGVGLTLEQSSYQREGTWQRWSK